MMEKINLLWQSLLSIVKILLKSKLRFKLPQNIGDDKELLILANGPSLNDTIDKCSEFFKGKTLMAVNFFVMSEQYTQLRPKLYLIADPLFWLVNEKRQQLFGLLAEKTTWPITFFIPYRALKNKDWKLLLANNPNINVVLYNTTPIEGFQKFCNWILKKGWGVPRPHNVLIPSIAMGLLLPFKKIYLAGADHSWLSEIRVTDDNEVLMHQKHFYDQGKSKAETVKKENLHTASIYTILYHMYISFKNYHVLEEYACWLGKEVINITPDSYIDAFKKMRI